MNRKQKLADDVPAREEMELHSMLSTELPPLDAAPDLLGSIQQRLGSRIAASIARHVGLTTVRARDGLWKNLTAGIRYKQLWQSGQGNSVLIEFAPGAALPVHRHLYQEEGIVLRGSLQHEGETLKLFDYHLSPAGSQHGQISSKDGALAFLRGSSLGDKVAMTKEILGGMLPKSRKDSVSIHNQTKGWREIQPGIRQKYLWRDDNSASRYLKLEPGATLTGENIPCFEECMMLSGEAFFGDILLQAGDYQAAAEGTQALDIFTDTGALFFVRGGE
jgi:quercetin dioxygenase-like cupin family protein